MLRRRSRRVLRDPLAEVRDWLAIPAGAGVETGLVASSIVARVRDNAVPSVCVEPHLPLAINNARKGLHLRAKLARDQNCRLPVTLITTL
jgi:hypothetical protein